MVYYGWGQRIKIKNDMKMKNALALLLLFSSMAGVAQTKSARNSPALSEANPETVGMSSERIARMDNIFQQAITHKIKPMSVDYFMIFLKQRLQKRMGCICLTWVTDNGIFQSCMSCW